MQYSITLTSCRRGVLDFPEGLWLVLLYTYALFIPNTVRRAAVAIGLMSATPLVLLFGMMWSYPLVGQCVATGQAAGLILMFCLAAGGSVLGVGLIGSLRRAVFVARQFGQYRLTRRIGAGGMGEVYLAEHLLLKRPCVVKVIFAHVHDPVVPPATRRPEIPADLDRVILRCLEKDPADRFQTAVDLEEALASCESTGLWTREHATRWWQEYERETATAPMDVA